MIISSRLLEVRSEKLKSDPLLIGSFPMCFRFVVYHRYCLGFETSGWMITKVCSIDPSPMDWFFEIYFKFLEQPDHVKSQIPFWPDLWKLAPEVCTDNLLNRRHVASRTEFKFWQRVRHRGGWYRRISELGATCTGSRSFEPEMECSTLAKAENSGLGSSKPDGVS